MLLHDAIARGRPRRRSIYEHKQRCPSGVGAASPLVHAFGLLALGAKAAPATETLLSALKDPAPDVRMTAAEAVCGLGHVDEAVPVLIALLSDKDYIIRNETLVTLCRIGPVAKTALPYLDKALAPGAQHRKIWSYDNVAAAIPLAQACLSDVSDAKAKLKLTRQKYLP